MSVSEKRDWYDKNCNKGTRRMFRNIYGLDLGTYEIKIYDKRRDRIRSAKNVIAIRDEKDILRSEMRPMQCMRRHLRIFRWYFPCITA